MTSEFHFDSRMTMSYTTRDIPDDCSWNDNYRGTDCNRGARCSNLLPKSGKEDVLSSLDEPVRFQKRGWSCSVLQSTSLLSSRFQAERILCLLFIIKLLYLIQRERERERIHLRFSPAQVDTTEEARLLLDASDPTQCQTDSDDDLLHA